MTGTPLPDAGPFQAGPLPVGQVRSRLLAWAPRAGRDLPWRRTRDPWAVLVSEVMLQQTQVARVAARWAPFLARFPTPSACAAAPLGDVVREWQGLGYNRRAVALHAAAVATVDRHDGALPATLEGLRALPGIGAYTARAVLAFAFERDVSVVDTNVGRILARLSGGRLTPARAQRLADGLVPAGEGWRWNQALFDLGALVCTRRRPDCGGCPLAACCAWRGDTAAEDPAARTAGAARPQARFEGSDRQGRGRLVASLSRGEVAEEALGRACGWPDDPARARRVADALVADGLAVRTASGGFRLP